MDDTTTPQETSPTTESVSNVDAEVGGDGTLAFHLETDLKDITASQKTKLTDSGNGPATNGPTITLLRGRALDPLKKFVEQELQPGSIYVLLAVHQAGDTQQNMPTNALIALDHLSLTVQLHIPKE